VTVHPGESRSIMAPGLTTRPPLRRGALPHEFAEIRRRANTGWGDRPTGSARIEGRPRPFGQDEWHGKLPGSCHSAVSGVSLEIGAGQQRPYRRCPCGWIGLVVVVALSPAWAARHGGAANRTGMCREGVVFVGAGNTKNPEQKSANYGERVEACRARAPLGRARAGRRRR
jgi:hypothetical protein